MSVVINEIEVVVAEVPAGDGTAPPPAPPLTPLEIAEVLERRARQALRLFAH